MDKNAIKTFAVESRRKMIESVKYQASLIGITADGISEPISKAEGMETYDYGAGQHTIYDEDIKKRASLVREINNKGFENVVEEVAYTWFNRIIAIRYMEVNDYLPTYTRVLSSEIEGKIEPDIITEAFDIDLDYSAEDREKIFKLKDESKLEELYQFLFIKQCNKLNEILPGLFERTDDYMELLLDIKFTDDEGIIRKLIKTISENDFETEVEIIGWLYQYYTDEKRDNVIDTIKSKTINKEDIPAATQLFTPDWIVKYMVDNSLGRYWVERNPNTKLLNFLNYFFQEPEQNDMVINKIQKIRTKLNIEDIKFFDPCMGSGHILVYAFDVFIEIYKELGYLESEIPELILKNNLFGLDIDKRAYQLSYFTLFMKGRYYDRDLLNKRIEPNVLFITSSNISEKTLNYIKNFDLKLGKIIDYLNKVFKNASEFGSLIKINDLEYDFLYSASNKLLNNIKRNLIDFTVKNEIENKIFPLIHQAELLSLKYVCVVTNPPYLNKYSKDMKNFARKYYEDYSKDLFSMFMYRNFDFCTDDGYVAFMTPMVWMFIKTYEKLRNFLIKNKTFISFIELEYGAIWDIAHVPVCTFILSNLDLNSEYYGTFLKLSKFEGGLDIQSQKVLEAINKDVNYKFIVNGMKFNKIPGTPIAYWIDEEWVNVFEKGNELQSICEVKAGLATANNDKFLRLWYEVDFNNVGLNFNSREESKKSNFKWFPYNKGGKFRKWYGNQDYLIDWYNDGQNLRNYQRATLRNQDFYFKRSISWSLLSSAYFGVRFYPNGFLFDVNGSSLFTPDKYYYYIGGLLSSKVATKILSILNSTLSFQVGNIQTVPLIFNDEKINFIESIVKENIKISKYDFDDYETSWNFLKHPFIKFKNHNLEKTFLNWENYKNEEFNRLKNNEIKLNELYSEIYSVNINPIIEPNEITINLADYEKDIKSFISYAVGCMFGRYSLDKEGLEFAGGKFDISKYSKFIPDDDNIIPILDTEYFNDDIVGRFVEFVKVCFGEETLEENLNFISNALNKKGKTSREILRDYFLNDFIEDHTKIYSKPRNNCAIYWQFDSGKQNAFKCLIYMHRYEPGLVARVRTDYLHKTQKAIEQNLAQCENIIANSSNKSEISKAKKDKTKYIKQLDEIKVYDEALAHIANQRIEIDLDDGVKVNHAKFQNVEISKEGQKTKKINLLKKI